MNQIMECRISILLLRSRTLSWYLYLTCTMVMGLLCFRDLYYQSDIEQRPQELEQLKDVERQLLAIQLQLQTLHDRIQAVSTRMHTHTCMHSHTHTCKNSHTHASNRTHTHTHTHSAVAAGHTAPATDPARQDPGGQYTHAYTHMHALTHTHTHASAHTHADA